MRDQGRTRTARAAGARPPVARLVAAAAGVSLLVSLPSCAGDPRRKAPSAPELEAPLAPPPASSSSSGEQEQEQPRAGCIVVRADFEGQPATVEGVLRRASGGPSPFVLRLARPRCVVGLEHASILTEVQVASTGADLRPLAGARLRISGDAIAGTNDLGGPAVVLLAKDFERLEPDDDAP